MKFISCLVTLAMFFLSNLAQADDTAGRVFFHNAGKILSGTDTITGTHCEIKTHADPYYVGGTMEYWFDVSNGHDEGRNSISDGHFGKKFFQRVLEYSWEHSRGKWGSTIVYYDGDDNITSLEEYFRGELKDNCQIE